MAGWAIMGRQEVVEGFGGCRERGLFEPSSLRRVVEGGAAVVVIVSDGARLGLRDPNRGCDRRGASRVSSISGGVGDLAA